MESDEKPKREALYVEKVKLEDITTRVMLDIKQELTAIMERIVDLELVTLYNQKNAGLSIRKELEKDMPELLMILEARATRTFEIIKKISKVEE